MKARIGEKTEEISDNDKDDLRKAVRESFGAKITQSVFGYLLKRSISPEASFTKKVIELGCDKLAAGDWGIIELKLNKNNLNSEYNNHEKTIGLIYFK